ncbi:hypothetical protein C2E25_05325 [Geothermobacter hydrogeniphilus]|uniref:Uncharacterized protein n=1 Tax=Geothermobacter hydrogeniphilus TaxID=1969733 RepID=A0A2K2HC13_9BACT|nr:hypothetical protein [Geothermobacter hydrogeniphilus]PNU20807.1 hypothetical protein C2E25_05325 [Geothermobacter hydrogeniphilus]
MKRQHLLIVLALGLVAAIGYGIWYDPYDQVAGERVAIRSRGQSRPTLVHKPGPHEVALRLELLERQENDFSGVKRDIFHFYVPPPPPPAPPPPPPPAPVVKQPLPSPPPEVRVAPPPMPPATRFTFLGLFVKEARQSVFLAAGDELFIVSEGTRFGKENQFQVEEMNADEIIIRQQGRSALIRVDLKDAEDSPSSLPGTVAQPGTTSDEPMPQHPVPPIRRPQLKSFKRYQP